MHLTRHTDYGLRLLMVLAARQPDKVSTSEIASFFSISLNHLHKIVQALQGAGLVKTTRGRSGGLTLARPPESIQLGEVIRLLEPDFHVVECMGEGGQCRLLYGCGLKGVLASARDAFLASLDGVTLAEITRKTPALSAQRREPEGPR